MRAIQCLLFGMVWVPLLLGSVPPGFAANATAGQGPGPSPKEGSFEQRVLEVIRNNPAAILEALERLEQQKEQDRRQKQASLLKELFPVPAGIIAASPVLGTGRDTLLVEFSDFQCPYCGQANRILKALTAQKGKSISLVYKHFPLSQIHPQALPAARAAWAAGQQGKFWPYHDALFSQQNKLSEAMYEKTAESLGLAMERFNRDRRSEASLRAIQADLALAERLELQGTPTFLLQRGGGFEVISLPELQERFPQRAATP